MKIRYIIYVLIAFLSFSCSNEESGKQQTLYGKVDVTVSVTLPQPETVNASTRSYTDTDIKNVDVLVFDKDGKFMERVKVEGNRLTATGTGVAFTVRLNATSEKRIIHLVTNGRTAADGATDRLNFNSLNAGMAEAAAISSLHTNNVNNGETLLNSVMPLVMWGRFVLDNGINIITTANNVKLLRSAACIQVKKVAGSSNGLNDFVIEGITVHKGMSSGFLAPADCTGAVSTPATANPVSGSELDYTKGWVHVAEPSLYIYERNCNVSDYMAVILKGKYKEKSGYYKIVMTDGNGTPLNVVRNHRYIITLVGVNGPGYANVATAVASAPSNALKVELKDEDIDFSCVVADGQHQIASSNNVFELYGKTGRTASATGVEICTMYSSRGILPVLSAHGAAAWLSNLKANALGDNRYRITGDFTSSGNSLVTTTLTMTCDNLSLPVEISWNPIISNQKDSDSYVFDLIKPADKNWNIRVVNPSSATGLFLHPSSATPAGYPGEGMLSELSSKYSAHAYLHVVIGSNKQGSVRKTYVSDGKTKAGKIMIVQ